MSVARVRKEAARRLGIDLQNKYRAFVEASGNDEILNASIVLVEAFNSNIEFIINVLKDWGGLDVKFEPMTSRPKILLPPRKLN